MAEVKLEDAPQGVRTYYDKGIAAMERDNLDYAMDMFEAALKLEPGLLQIRKLLRAAAVKKTKATPPGKLAIAKATARLMKASARVKKNPRQALEMAEQLLRIDPLNRSFAKVQCEAAEAADLPEAAILTLEVLNDNKPPTPSVLEPLARLYRTTQQFDLEYKCRGQICKLAPHDTEALKQMKDAAARLTMGKAGWQKAESYRDVIRPEADRRDELEEIQAKVDAEPKDLNLRRALADHQLRRKQYAAAIDTLQACRDMAGGNVPQIDRKLLEAREHLLMSKLAEAEDGDDRETTSTLRNELAEMRLKNAAAQTERYPNDLQLKFDYGKLLFENGRFTEAIQQLQHARRNPQRRIRALLYLAKAFKAKGQLQIAREQLETALPELSTMDETKKEILYELGSLCEADGLAGEADHYFREIYAVDIAYRDVAKRVER
ncbi:tetratricopeptide repeat protein [Pontiella sp.]|uniref:tetratricopeptide repeat protein n=1 Tax=Pontiella sp. TaxID=2837462 RepID=UPI00356A8B58